jgi:hypothetical protein
VDSIAFSLAIVPRNVGPHPCKAKLERITLQIGDESYETPSHKEWVLLASGGSDLATMTPAGSINETGVTKVRENRYRSNRIELSFVMHTSTIDGGFTESTSHAYEILVAGTAPLAVFRAEWVKPFTASA